MAEAPPAPVVVAVAVAPLVVVAVAPDVVVGSDVVLVAVLVVLAVWDELAAACVVEAAPVVTLAVPGDEVAAVLAVSELSVPEAVLSAAASSLPEQASTGMHQALAKHIQRRSRPRSVVLVAMSHHIAQLARFGRGRRASLQ